MTIKLTVIPRHIFTALGKPGSAMKDECRADLLAKLTQD
jgi:hypothetical protein